MIHIKKFGQYHLNEDSDFKYGYKIRTVKNGYELVVDTYHKKELVDRNIIKIKELKDLKKLIGDYSNIPIDKDFVFLDIKLKNDMGVEE